MRPKKQSDITGIALTIFVHEANKKSDITEILLTIFVHGAKKKCDHWKMPQSIFPTGKILCKVFFPWEKVFLAKNLATIITVRLHVCECGQLGGRASQLVLYIRHERVGGPAGGRPNERRSHGRTDVKVPTSLPLS